MSVAWPQGRRINHSVDDLRFHGGGEIVIGDVLKRLGKQERPQRLLI